MAQGVKSINEIKRIAISSALIAALGLVVYFNSLDAKFIWDDYYLVKNNALIKNPSHISYIFKTGIAQGAGRSSASYRPLQILTYMLDYSFWKFDVRGYHLTNIILHIGMALSVFWLISILYGGRFLPLITAMLFIIHPVHAEAVTYISGRADPLAGIFIILSLVFYVKYTDSHKRYFILRQRQNRTFKGADRHALLRINPEQIPRPLGRGCVEGFILISLSSAILALLSRENSIIIPLLLLLYHHSFNKKIKLGSFIIITGAVLLYIGARITLLKDLLPDTGSLQTTIFGRIPGLFIAITNYIKIMMLPIGLHMEYGDRLFSFADPKAIAGALIFILLLTYVVRRGTSKGIAQFSILWFFIALLPSSNLYPINAYMAEHWLYIPSIGFFLFLANGLNQIYVKKGFGQWAVVITVILLFFYALITVKQNTYWHDPIAFYERTIRYAPESFKVCNDLGLAYHDAGREEDAVALYKRALSLKPNFTDAYNNLGISYKAMGRVNEAMALYKKAIEINPAYAMAYYNLANAYYDTGNKEKAISLYNESIKKNPYNPKAYYNLGNAYRDNGMLKEAETAYKNAIATDHEYAYPYNNLGILYYQTDRKKEAIPLYRKAISLDPYYVDAINNLGMACYEMGKIDEAISLFEKAIGVNPAHNLAYYNLSILYYYKRDYREAVRFYDEALRLGHKPNTEFLEALVPYRRSEQ